MVLSEALLLPVVATGSPPPLTLAVLSTDGIAVGPTDTTSVIGLLVAPAASVPACTHVTVPPPKPHTHPVPDAETNPSPAGSVSVTVIGPVVVTEPGWLVTSSV